MIEKKHPARKAAEQVRVERAKTREANRQLKLLEHKLLTYEAIAPWLSESEGMTLSQFIEDIKRLKDEKNEFEEKDPVRNLLNPDEWNNLSSAERSQLALDRYCNPDRKKSLWARISSPS